MADAPLPPPPAPGAPPPPPPPMGYAPAGYAMGSPMGAPPRGSGKAKAALVLGIVGIFLCFTIVVPVLAVIFGVKGRKEIDRSQGAITGRGKAIAGLILGIVGVVLGALFITVAIVNRDKTALDDVEVGMCLDLPDGARIDHATQKSCNKPHDAEVVDVEQIDEPDDTPWPGLSGFQPIVEKACRQDAAAYVAASRQESLQLRFIAPDSKSWDDGSRRLICYVQDPSGQLRESVRG